MRKLWICILAMMMLLSNVASAQIVPPDMTVLDKISVVERALYGNEQTGSLLDRVSKMEHDLYGQESKDSLVARLDKLYSYMKEPDGNTPTFLMKLTGVEWTLTHSVTSLPAKNRLENAEKVLLGNVSTGAFDDRLNKLMRLAYTGEQIGISQATINKDTLIKVKMVTPLDTRQNRAGDAVEFQAVDDVYANGVLVIAKGAQGTGKVTKVEPAKNFGRDAVLTVSFDNIEAVDSSLIDTVLGDKAKEQTKSLATAAGASVAGIAILGPIGVVGGAFIHGKEASIPADTELFVQTKADTVVYGLKTR